MQTLKLIAPILAGIAVVLSAWWLERLTRRAGLAFAILGSLLVVAGAFGMVTDPGWLPAVFLINGAGFFYFAWWKRSRSESLKEDERRAAQ